MGVFVRLIRRVTCDLLLPCLPSEVVWAVGHNSNASASWRPSRSHVDIDKMMRVPLGTQHISVVNETESVKMSVGLRLAGDGRRGAGTLSERE